MRIDNYKNLVVWNKSMDFAVDVYMLLKGYPQYELYGICDQMRRSAVSIPSNIAEGFCRDSLKETLRHLSISRGSLGELETQIILSERLNYIDKAYAEDLLYRLNGINVMLISLMARIRRNLNDLTT